MSLSSQFIQSMTSGSISSLCNNTQNNAQCGSQSISLSQSSVNMQFNHVPVAHMDAPGAEFLMATGIALLMARLKK